ncbi:hypothetical protein L2E82_03904 [Cichorium intybus]|uniref:Uncharacterized protein n=1 Tax=Cichorium intybus TaxID=13427 RepID=A0ACB9H4M2_CICIN|nr:hypothetical protein L2E82_03904 [Cichorium intybus]
MASTKAAVAKKAPSTAKPRSHPTYAEMIKEAIVALKERTGSSQYAIAKHIEDNQKDLPANFKKLMSIQLKKLAASGKLTKVKSSFKLATIEKKPTEKKAPAAAKKATGKKAPAAKKAAAPKAKSAAPKTKSAAPKTKSATTVKPKAKAKTPVKAKKAVKKATPAKKAKSIKSPAKKVAVKKVAAKKAKK